MSPCRPSRFRRNLTRLLIAVLSVQIWNVHPVFAASSPPNGGRIFNGLDNKITIADSNSLNITGDLSIEGWVKTQVYANEANQPTLYDSHDNTGGFRLFIKGGKLCYYVVNAVLQTNGNGTLCSTGVIADGAWHHFALTNTNASGATPSNDPDWKVYIDGAVDVTWGAYAPTTYHGSRYIGDISLDGILSDFRLYNRAITAQEVSDAYAGTAPTVNSALVGYWPLDDIGTSIVDHSSYGNNGTFTAAKAADTYTVSAAHPRLMLTSDKLTDLRASQTQNTAQWQRFQTRVADRMNIAFVAWTPSDGTTGFQWWSSVRDLALAYQITGDTSYADRAIAWFIPTMDSTNDSILPAGDNNGYNYRYLDAAAESYDWLYNRMTVQQRQTVATYLMDQADLIWSETNANRNASSWAISDGGNNYFLGFMNTWMAALAVAGDAADTGTNSRYAGDRATYHVKLGLSKYRTVVQPYIDSFGKGGAFPESTSYDSISALSLNLLAFDTATNKDLINEPGETFFQDSVIWRIFSASPDYQYHYQNGSQSRVPSGPIGNDDLERAYVPSSAGSDTTINGYGKQWINNTLAAASPLSNVQWFDTQGYDFLIYPESTVAVDYSQSLPTSHFFSGPQIFIKRSDWTTNATYWGFTSGDLFESHQNMDMNGFSIYKGSSWLTGSATFWSSTGLLQASSSQNTLTIGGLGQTWQTPRPGHPESAGTVEKHETGDKYAYIVGQAAPAYVQSNGTSVLSDYTRKLVNLSDDLFVIYDRVSSINAGADKEWHLQTGTSTPTVNGNSYSFSNGSAKGFGTSLLPLTGTTLTPTSTNLDGAATKSMVITTNNNQNQDYLLNTLEVAPNGQAVASSSQVLTPSNGNMQGAELGAAGGWAVLMGKTDQITGTVGYTTSAHRAHHLVTDLVLNTAYTLTTQDAGSAVLRTATVTSTAEGTVRFDSSDSAELSYSLAQGVSLPVPGTPSITAPAGGSSLQDATPTLTASAFSEPSGSQAAAQWQIAGSSFFTSPTVDTGDDAVHLTSYTPSTLADGTHYLRVRYKDANGTYSAWSPTVQVTVDTSATTFSAEQVTPTADGAVVTWTSSRSGSSWLEYGVAGTYGHVTTETDTGSPVTSHSVTLTGLLSCAKYQVRTHSHDPISADIVGSLHLFTTTGCPGGASIAAADSGTVTTASGGTVTLASPYQGKGSLALTVPAGFAATDATFQTEQLDTTAFTSSVGLPIGKQQVGTYLYQLTALSDPTTAIHTFNQPVRVTLGYQAGDLTGLDPATLTIQRWDSGTGWSALNNCAVDQQGLTVACDTNGFSVFTLLADVPAATPTPTPTSTPTPTPTASATATPVVTSTPTSTTSTSDPTAVPTSSASASGVTQLPVTGMSPFVLLIPVVTAVLYLVRTLGLGEISNGRVNYAVATSDSSRFNLLPPSKVEHLRRRWLTDIRRVPLKI